MASLVDQIKQLQRSGDKGKQAWVTYCDESLGGVRDPNRHDSSTLQEFLDWWHTESGGAGGDEDGGYGEDTTHLVVQIKNMQRRSAKGKQAWSQYCDDYLGGVHDPSRQDAKTLQSFLHWWRTEGGGGDPAATGAPPPELVDQIKELQRTDPEAKWKWGEYCDSLGGMRDPSRHDTATLEKFLRDYSRGHDSQVHAPALAPLAAPPKSASPPDFIKQGAKLSKEFKQAWIAYCKHWKEADSNPSKIGETFLTEFAGYVAGLVQADLATTAGGAAPPREEAAGAPAAKSAAKRPLADALDNHTPEPKKKLTIRKVLADEIRRLNAEGGLSTDIRIPAVAAALAKLEEHDAMNVLRALYDDSGDPIAEDPNQFIVDRVMAAHSHE